MCPGSSDPFYVVTYYKNGTLLLGHMVKYLKSRVSLDTDTLEAGEMPGPQLLSQQYTQQTAAEKEIFKLHTVLYVQKVVTHFI